MAETVGDTCLFHTTIEHEGTWCGIEIPYTMLQRLGWTERDVRVVVKRQAHGIMVRREDEQEEEEEECG